MPLKGGTQMDQQKIGRFLKELRKEKNLTQEELAEKLNVSGRTVSRWETGTNMPDISLLVELADFYNVSIPEIIDGERKSEEMNQETREIAVKMAEYSKQETGLEKRKTAGILLIIFGTVIIISAMAVISSDSSWGSIFSVIGGIILTAGIYFRIKDVVIRRSHRILCVVGCIAALFCLYAATDYATVAWYHQVPRFCYSKSYGENQVECKTLFFTAVWKNPGTSEETVEIVK